MSIRIHGLLIFFGVALLATITLAGPPAAFAANGDCGQPVTNGANPTASDCLFILRTAVGSETCTPECVCDTSGAGGTTASDALICLKKAVGQNVTLNCQCPISTTTSTTITTSTSSTTTSTTSTTVPAVTTTTIGGTTTTSIGGTTTTIGGTTTTIGGTTTTIGGTTTTTIGGGAECPTSAELTIAAGTRGACTTNADCNVGTCNDTLGRCQTVTDLDTGWTGIAHDSDLTDNVVVKADISCPGGGPTCGQCNVTGVIPDTYCRCANDNAIVCDQPLAEDAANCGAGNICNCYLGPPLALSAGNTPACVVNKLAVDVSGTANVDEGSGATALGLRSIVYTGEALNVPCPVCGGTCTAGKPNGTTCFFNSDCDTSFGGGDGTCGNFDTTPNDGQKDGTCFLGDDDGVPCDVNAINQSFPAPGGGGHSFDCFPLAGKNVSGAGLIINITQTTGTTSLPSTITCDFAGAGLCPCGICDNNTNRPCHTDGDCESAGVCQHVSQFDPRPNQCDGTCTDLGGGNGECDSAGPNDSGCDGMLKANGGFFIQCSSNDDCDPINIGLQGGACTLSKQRPCFLPTIEATGNPDPQFPVGVGTFCIPPTANGAINNVAGLPGPARVVNQGIVQFNCTNGAYEAGVGCPP